MLVNRHTTAEQRISFYEEICSFWTHNPDYDIKNEIKDEKNTTNLGRYAYGKVEKDKVTLNISGPIDPYFGNTRDSVKFLDDNKAKEVQVNIASPGGILEDGLILASKLRNMKESGIRITTNAVGAVASAATIPYMVGNTRSANPGSRFLFHAPYLIGAFMLNSANIQKTMKRVSDYLEAGKMALLDSYAADKMDLNFAKTLMNGEDNWFSREEAIKNNIITENAPIKVELIKPDKETISPEDSIKIKNVFAEASKYWNGEIHV